MGPAHWKDSVYTVFLLCLCENAAMLNINPFSDNTGYRELTLQAELCVDHGKFK